MSGALAGLESSRRTRVSRDIASRRRRRAWGTLDRGSLNVSSPLAAVCCRGRKELGEALNTLVLRLLGTTGLAVVLSGSIAFFTSAVTTAPDKKVTDQMAAYCQEQSANAIDP